jgi:hypothetical protein
MSARLLIWWECPQVTDDVHDLVGPQLMTEVWYGWAVLFRQVLTRRPYLVRGVLLEVRCIQPREVFEFHSRASLSGELAGIIVYP